VTEVPVWDLVTNRNRQVVETDDIHSKLAKHLDSGFDVRWTTASQELAAMRLTPVSPCSTRLLASSNHVCREFQDAEVPCMRAIRILWVV
jgi:hypothetical protein